ncbi:LON peptidase substrate-binding domain-containing protein [Candidatus Liberibacter africanus]|uniref:Peptidase S16 lon domain-containing protein n=1 Tax=Candidatus Liberibacter africanus PTSAPSY TaxID=1277257 RepID=A0A0G3I6D4_LIBAF|nr:LON peptidase substrate-binding domain-containing protein [Candidatus Liberibacter africanus]AKK20033.1 peptidase S16 lon domain-containing protein [Candidatus Liberibacter africanus PTSAPSY]QTP63860.1 LON peptidase substrate-binding domain-containing protein [Candidatus Liberibacter africanus]
MKIGNTVYKNREDLPCLLPIFPLLGMLLLPGSRFSFSVYERSCVAMFDSVLAGDRLIGLVQPAISGFLTNSDNRLSQIGCIGRITSFVETDDGHYVMTVTGVCRFRLLEESYQLNPWRCFYIAPFMSDLIGHDNDGVDRIALLEVFRNYLAANNLESDWESIEGASNEVLVNSLAMLSPFSEEEKQALLEAPDFRSRVQTLISIMKTILTSDYSHMNNRIQ